MCHAQGSGPARPPRFIMPSVTAWWWWWRMGDSGASRTSPPAWVLWFSSSERNSPWASTYCDGSAISEHELPHTHVHAYITTVFLLHSGHQFIRLQPRTVFLSLAETVFCCIIQISWSGCKNTSCISRFHYMSQLLKDFSHVQDEGQSHVYDHCSCADL